MYKKLGLSVYNSVKFAVCETIIFLFFCGFVLLTVFFFCYLFGKINPAFYFDYHVSVNKDD